MDVIIAGRAATFNIALKDGAGALVASPDSCSWVLLNGAGTEVTPAQTITASGSIVSISPDTTIGSSDLRAYRLIRVTFVKSGITYIVDHEFVLEADVILAVGNNSFQTYPDSIIRAMDISDIDDFRLSEKSSKQAALITAFHGLSTLNFYVDGARYGQIDKLTDVEFEALSTRFKEALRKAQIVEANEYLSTNSAHKKRQLGIFSETIGESSMFFRTGKPIPLPVTRRALDILRGYVVWEMGVGRA